MYKDPYLTLPNTPDAEGKRNWCYGPNAKLLTPVKPSSYKCPPGWVQNNYVIGDTSTGYSSDPNNGFCTNPYLEPFYAKSQTAFVPLMVNFYGTMYPMCQVGEQKSIARFAYGPLFNQYPNNANIPDATPIANATQPVNTVAPDQWFFPNPPPANWAELSLPDSSEANIPTTYTCPEGWTQNKDVTDLSSGTCTSVGKYANGFGGPYNVYGNAIGPQYTLYYGPKYNKWPNNNNIPSLSEILINPPPGDFKPNLHMEDRFTRYSNEWYDALEKQKDVNVTSPTNFYYKERPYYWPAPNPPEQTKTPPTVIYTQNPTIPPPIGNPKLPPYVTPGAPSIVTSVTPSIVTSVTPSIVTSVAPSIVTTVAPSIVTPIITPRPEGLTDPEGSRSITPSIITPRPPSSKGPSPAPAKTIINGIPDEYLFIGISIFVIFILLLVIII